MKIFFGNREKELTRVENENPESTDIIYTFTTYAEKDQEYAIRIISQFNAEFTLTAVRLREDKETENVKEYTVKEEEPEIEEKPREDNISMAVAENEMTNTNEIDNLNTEKPQAETTEEIMEETETKTKEKPEIEDETGMKNEFEVEEKPIQNYLDDEDMLNLGFYKVQVIMRKGADIYAGKDEDDEPIAHADYGTVFWIKPTEDPVWSECYYSGEDAESRFVRWENMLIILHNESEPLKKTTEDGTEEGGEPAEKEEEPLARSLNMYSSIQGWASVEFGTNVTISAEPVNFREDDVYTCQWQYSKDGINYENVDGASDLIYSYLYSLENYYYSWRIVIMIEDSIG